MSAVDYESSSDWDLVLSESAPLVESGFGSMELVENQRVKVGKAHSAGGVIGAIYRFTGSEGTEIDLGTVNYETDNRFERASLASDSGLVEVSKGSVVQIATGHTAGGTVGDYYVYTGDSPFEGDLSAVNFNTGIDFIDVATKLLGLEAFGTDEEWVRLAPISASGTQNLDGGHIVQSGSDFYRFTGEDDTDFAFSGVDLSSHDDFVELDLYQSDISKVQVNTNDELYIAAGHDAGGADGALYRYTGSGATLSLSTIDYTAGATGP